MMAQSFTKLLQNSTLARVERMRLQPLRRLTNRSRGEHLAGKGGTSTEFNDFRDYVAGDDMRYVDWNIFSRLNRPYLKLYRHEEEMHVVIILDASTSMQFGEKFERARQTAAAIAIMGLMNLERVSIYSCRTPLSAPQQLPPCTGRTSVKRMLEFLERLESGGDLFIDEAVDDVLKVHRGRGIAVILSDFMTFGSLERPFNRLFSAGLEVFAIQFLASDELRPQVNGDLRFVDSETSRTLDITSADDLLKLYAEHLQNLQDYLAQICRQRSGRFLSVDTEDPIEDLLLDRFRRQGWAQ